MGPDGGPLRGVREPLDARPGTRHSHAGLTLIKVTISVVIAAILMLFPPC
jgi:hypothetical protein